MGESADLPRYLRVVGGAAAAGVGDPGPGLLLGLYEGQSASAELHINPPSHGNTAERMALTETFIYLFRRNRR